MVPHSMHGYAAPPRRVLTRVGELTTHPVAFAIVVYAIAWLIFSSETFGWGAIATLATWLMTLFINRTEHRDTQANLVKTSCPAPQDKRKFRRRRGLLKVARLCAAENQS